MRLIRISDHVKCLVTQKVKGLSGSDVTLTDTTFIDDAGDIIEFTTLDRYSGFCLLINKFLTLRLPDGKEIGHLVSEWTLDDGYSFKFLHGSGLVAPVSCRLDSRDRTITFRNDITRFAARLEPATSGSDEMNLQLNYQPTAQMDTSFAIKRLTSILHENVRNWIDSHILECSPIPSTVSDSEDTIGAITTRSPSPSPLDSSPSLTLLDDLDFDFLMNESTDSTGLQVETSIVDETVTTTVAQFEALPGQEYEDNEQRQTEKEDQETEETDEDEINRNDTANDDMDAKSDRDYINLLLRYRKNLSESCFYFNANYMMSRPNLSYLYDEKTTTANIASSADEDEDLAAMELTPCIGKCQTEGFFAYDPKCGVWRACSNIMIEEMLVESIERFVPQLTRLDQKYLGRNANSVVLRRVFAKQTELFGMSIMRQTVRNVDVFALNNGYLVENGTKLRRTTANDAIFLTTGWSYRTQLAKSKRAELELFLQQLFPMPEERGAVLDYVSGLLDGHRRQKRFLVLTDRRQGNNGKSTFLKFLQMFFGDAYYAKSVRFLTGNTSRSASAGNRNAHDAGMECMNGKRLLVADELAPYMHLDSATIKDLVSVPDTIVQGRSFGKGTTFKFVWQAGIIAAFNEGQFPTFDANDRALLSRMLVCYMRSRFVFDGEVDPRRDSEPYTYPADTDIIAKFPNWRSAFLDLLMERRQQLELSGHSPPVPSSMLKSRDELVMDMRDSDGQLSEWMRQLCNQEMRQHTIGELLNGSVLALSAVDLFDEYTRYRANNRNLHLDMLTKSMFVQKIESVCASLGSVGGSRCLFKKRYQFQLNEQNKQRRNVVILTLPPTNHDSTKNNCK